MTEADVKLATANFGGFVDDSVQGGAFAKVQEEVVTEADQAAQKAVNQSKISSLGTGQGIVAALLAPYGVKPGEAITAALDFSVQLNSDTTLVDKEIKAQKKLADELSQSRQINAQWSLNIDLNSNLDDVRRRLQQVIDALGLAAPVSNSFTGVSGSVSGNAPRRVGGAIGDGYAAGGDVFRGQLGLVGEEGKPELFIPRSDGRIIPGNETASILRMLGTERLPSQANVIYAPVSNQYLAVDARGTNARDVTQAIQRTQRKGSLFTSSSDLIRGRDFLRARGL